MSAKFDFCLITPVYQGVDGATCWAVERAHQSGLYRFLWIPGTEGKGDALIARSRSIAATAFLTDGPSDYMIFLDSDIVFDPLHLKILLEDLRAGYDLIGGLYPVRAGVQLASYWWGGIVPEGPSGIYEVQFLSTGFMGISKRLLQKLVDELALPLLHPNDPMMRSYPFFVDGWTVNDVPDKSGNRHIWLSEDWDFNQKARQVGVKAYLDTRLLLGHVGTRIVTLADVAKYEVAKVQERRQEIVADPALVVTDFVAASTQGVVA